MAGGRGSMEFFTFFKIDWNRDMLNHKLTNSHNLKINQVRKKLQKKPKIIHKIKLTLKTLIKSTPIQLHIVNFMFISKKKQQESCQKHLKMKNKRTKTIKKHTQDPIKQTNMQQTLSKCY